MTTEATLDTLRYKSEGADLDFKQAQYRFIKGTEPQKAELLKDIIAMANAWRDSTAHILLGFKDCSPHPAEVLGIAEHIDDATIQQFINSKIKPKLQFHYEERIYEGKTIGIITIPKQSRPFYLSNAYGHLKSNVVYVRRGSSTDEAEPPEIAKMVINDSSRGAPEFELSLLNSDNEELQPHIALSFPKFEVMPDYARTRSNGLFYRGMVTLTQDNKNYWRELAEYIKNKQSLIKINFTLTNRSTFALTSAKLEISVNPLDGQAFTMVAADDLPGEPKSEYNTIQGIRDFSRIISGRDKEFIVSDSGAIPLCHARLGTLLPGETARTADSLAVNPSGAGKIIIKVRVLAAELEAPVEYERLVEVTGCSEMHDFDELLTMTEDDD